MELYEGTHPLNPSLSLCVDELNARRGLSDGLLDLRAGRRLSHKHARRRFPSDTLFTE